MRLNDVIKFQKALALAGGASNQYEAEAAERAARQVMQARSLDPMLIPDVSLYSHANFADNAALKKLRDEYCAAHPDRVYKVDRSGSMRWVNRPGARKPRPKREPVINVDGLFDDFMKFSQPPDQEAVNTVGVNTSNPDLSEQAVNTSGPEPTSASPFDPFDLDPKAVNTSEPAGSALADAEPVNTKPSSDRNRDRHSPGYMREYMRRRRAARKPSS
jgi:hypothetical protein